MRTKLIILGCLLLAGMFVPSFAQTNEENPLQGEWVFESISAFEEGVQKIPFSVDSLDNNVMSCCEVPSEMDIQQEEIVFVLKNKTVSEKYNVVVTENSLCFSICTEWKIVNNKLQLQWTQDIANQEPRVLSIVLTYKLK